MCVPVCVPVSECVCVFENGVWSALSLHCLLLARRESHTHKELEQERGREQGGEEEADACLVGRGRSAGWAAGEWR